jgi:hypothetical protein
VIAGFGASWAAAGCTKSAYVIGALCPAGDAGGSVDPRCATPGPVTFSVALDRSGASLLDDPLTLPSGPVAATFRLRGEHATATAWPVEPAGALARGAGVPGIGVAAPFTDGTLAVGLAAAAPTFVAADATVGAVGADDFALEIVLRAAAGTTLLDKRAGATGWSLATDAAGHVVLTLDDADPTHLVQVASEPLTAGAWYDCMAWVSHAGFARVDCDGRDRGALVTLPALGTLDSSAILAVGGGAAASVAYVAIYRLPSTALGSGADWLAADVRRFAELTGAWPSVAGGNAAPVPGLRDSAAYLDLQAQAGAPRHLFLVGPDWPRVACRTDAAGTYDCGFLSEPQRMRGLPADPLAWQATALTLGAGAVPFLDGEPRFAALVPSTAAAGHGLSLTGAFGAARQILSVFAHADGGASRLGLSAGNAGTATFDVVAGTVVSAPAAVAATIEPWGNGVFRCAYAFDALDGPTPYAVDVLDATGAATFAGDGATPAFDVAGLQLDIGLAHTSSLLGADPEPADHLTFAADHGNLPATAAVSVELRVLLPPGPRLTDQAVLNINRDGSFDDQVQLFVRGDLGRLTFWGLSGGATHWTFDHPASLLDGLRHAVDAEWDATSARLVVDGVPATQAAIISNAQPFALDRIDVGFSLASSGALEGLVAGLRIATP